MGHVWNTATKYDEELSLCFIRDDEKMLLVDNANDTIWWVQVDDNCMLRFTCNNWVDVCKRADEVIALFENTGCKDEQ